MMPQNRGSYYAVPINEATYATSQIPREQNTLRLARRKRRSLWITVYMSAFFLFIDGVFCNDIGLCHKGLFLRFLTCKFTKSQNFNYFFTNIVVLPLQELWTGSYWEKSGMLIIISGLGRFPLGARPVNQSITYYVLDTCWTLWKK